MNLTDYLNITEDGLDSELKLRAERILRNALFIVGFLALAEVIAAGWFAYDIGDLEGWYLFIAAVIFIAIESILILSAVKLVALLVYAQGVTIALLQDNGKKTESTKHTIKTQHTNTLFNTSKAECSSAKVKAVYPTDVKTWTCRCGKVHPIYMSSCECGMSHMKNRELQVQKTSPMEKNQKK